MKNLLYEFKYEMNKWNVHYIDLKIVNKKENDFKKL